MPLKELKEVCNKLVGQWSCEQTKDQLIFHLNEELFKTTARLTAITEDGTVVNTVYGVGVFLSGEEKERSEFYFDMGEFNKHYFKIESITRDMLIIRQYWMQLPPQPLVTYSNHTLIYKRTIDISTGEDILKAIDLT